MINDLWDDEMHVQCGTDLFEVINFPPHQSVDAIRSSLSEFPHELIDRYLFEEKMLLHKQRVSTVNPTLLCKLKMPQLKICLTDSFSIPK